MPRPACITRRVNVDLGIWGKLTRLVMTLLVVAGLLGVAVWYLPLIRQNERMRKEVYRLHALEQKEEEAGKQLRASVDALHNDPKAVERQAREQLRYARPGETIFRFESPTNSAALR